MLLRSLQSGMPYFELQNTPIRQEFCFAQTI